LVIRLRWWWNLGSYQIIIVQIKKKWPGEACENVHRIGEVHSTFFELRLQSFLVQLELSWQELPFRAVHGDEAISFAALMTYFSFFSFLFFFSLIPFIFFFIQAWKRYGFFFSNIKLDLQFFFRAKYMYIKRLLYKIQIRLDYQTNIYTDMIVSL